MSKKALLITVALTAFTIGIGGALLYNHYVAVDVGRTGAVPDLCPGSISLEECKELVEGTDYNGDGYIGPAPEGCYEENCANSDDNTDNPVTVPVNPPVDATDESPNDGSGHLSGGTGDDLSDRPDGGSADGGGGTSCTRVSGQSALFVSQSVPSSLKTGELRSVYVTFQNNGTATWLGGTSGYKLGSQNPPSNFTWCCAKKVRTFYLNGGGEVDAR